MVKPPAHKSGTAGQIVTPIGAPVYDKMADGCCHKTVIERCKDCSFSPNMHAQMGPLSRSIDDYYTSRQSMNTTQRGKLAASIGRQEALKTNEATTPLIDYERRYKRLVGALVGLCEYADSYEPASMYYKVVWSGDIKQVIKETT